MIRSLVRGSGAALPRRIMKNADFEGMVETSDEWIAQRTGIRQRHIAADDETTASLGEAAAREGLANAGLTPDDLDLIVKTEFLPKTKSYKVLEASKANTKTLKFEEIDTKKVQCKTS